MKKIFIIYHGRFPGEKAAALFAAKEANSLIPFGKTTIIAPRRLQRSRQSPYAYYQLDHAVHITYLPILDLFILPGLGAVAFLVSNATFALSLFFYSALKIGQNDLVITNEPFPAFVATLFSRRVVFEVHDFPERHPGFYRMLFTRVHTVLCTNEWKRDELRKRFHIPEHKLLVERNAVDLAQFGQTERGEARQHLGLESNKKIAVYTGHLYEHKGAGVLAQAAAHLPEVEVIFVGGTQQDVARFAQQFGSLKNIRIVGQRPHSEIPLWQAVADVLVLPNSAEDTLSAQYTSPMKLFEYMASGRPIVASRVTAITEVLPEDAAYFVEPDSPQALAGAILHVLNDSGASMCAQKAHEAVIGHSWERRAKRLVTRLSL